jgi:hypothetical protein
LLAVNPECLKFSRGHVDFFFAQNIVALLHFQVAGLAIEVPAGPLFEWSGDHRLRRIKLNKLAVEIHPGPAGNPVFVYREQIGVGDRARSVHFKLKKVFPVNVLRSLEAVQNWQTDLAVGICFYVRNIQSLSDFLGHVVAPACTRCGGNNGSSENGTEAATRNGDTNISHDVHSHA